MATRDRPIDRGRRRGRELRADLGRELRTARIGAGLSQAAVGHAVGIHRSAIGKIERATLAGVSIQRLAETLAIVGLELSCRAYPVGPPLRDAAHIALLGRSRDRIGAAWHWQYEVPMGLPGDLRAWDAVLAGATLRIGVEAETRLRDVQALLRRIEGKRRDSGVGRVLLIVGDTRGNRAAVHAAGPILGATFSIPPTAAWAALRRGRDPGGDAMLFA